MFPGRALLFMPLFPWHHAGAGAPGQSKTQNTWPALYSGSREPGALWVFISTPLPNLGTSLGPSPCLPSTVPVCQPRSLPVS